MESPSTAWPLLLFETMCEILRHFAFLLIVGLWPATHQPNVVGQRRKSFFFCDVIIIFCLSERIWKDFYCTWKQHLLLSGPDFTEGNVPAWFIWSFRFVVLNVQCFLKASAVLNRLLYTVRFLQLFLRGRVGVQLFSLMGDPVIDSLLRLKDTSPTKCTADCGVSSLHQALIYIQKMTSCFFHAAETECWGGGLCASIRGERIMAKQRASLPLSMLPCTSHLPQNNRKRWSGCCLLDALDLDFKSTRTEIKKVNIVFIVSGTVCSKASLTNFKV